jgi:hypothetical protein
MGRKTLQRTESSLANGRNPHSQTDGILTRSSRACLQPITMLSNRTSNLVGGTQVPHCLRKNLKAIFRACPENLLVLHTCHPLVPLASLPRTDRHMAPLGIYNPRVLQGPFAVVCLLMSGCKGTKHLARLCWDTWCLLVPCVPCILMSCTLQEQFSVVFVLFVISIEPPVSCMIPGPLNIVCLHAKTFILAGAGCVGIKIAARVHWMSQTSTIAISRSQLSSLIFLGS